MPKYAIAGVPDIIIIHEGKFIGIEVKRPKGKLSEAQEDFQDLCRVHGGTYILATSIDDMRAAGL